jgi:hypothetical protein
VVLNFLSLFKTPIFAELNLFPTTMTTVATPINVGDINTNIIPVLLGLLEEFVTFLQSGSLKLQSIPIIFVSEGMTFTNISNLWTFLINLFYFFENDEKKTSDRVLMLLDIFVSFDVFAGCLTKQHAFSMCKSERLLKIMVKGWELKYLNLEFKWEFARSSINSFHMSTSSSFDEGYDKKGFGLRSSKEVLKTILFIISISEKLTIVEADPWQLAILNGILLALKCEMEDLLSSSSSIVQHWEFPDPYILAIIRSIFDVVDAGIKSQVLQFLISYLKSFSVII